MDRQQMAHEAFWGKNEALYAHLESLASYREGGVEWPANGLSLADCVRLVAEMTEEELEAVAATC